MLSALKEWDRELLIYLNNLGSEPFDKFWLFVTQIESWIPLFILLILLIFYFLKNTTRSLLVVAATLVVFGSAFGVMELTKALVQRTRPNNVDGLSELLRVLQSPTDYSFFSGHAASGFAVTVFLVLALRKYSKWVYLLFLWPLLFSFSRIYVGVHFPTDILTGALVGSLFAMLGYRLFRRRFLT